jgi:hypothetical protein
MGTVRVIPVRGETHTAEAGNHVGWPLNRGVVSTIQVALGALAARTVRHAASVIMVALTLSPAAGSRQP